MIDKLYNIKRKIFYREIQPLFDSLAEVRYSVVKGEVLSQQIYGFPDRRKSSDIDILIDKKNVKFLEKHLLDLGFSQKNPTDCSETRRNRVLCMAYSHQIPSYHKEKIGFDFNVDVNFDIFWGEYDGKRCVIDDFLNGADYLEIYGVKVKTLPKDKAFVQLVLHHYKEMNSLFHLSKHNTITIEKFKDIYDFVKNNTTVLSCDVVTDLSERYSIGSFFYYMFYFIFEIFQDEKLKEYIDALGKFRDDVLLNSYGLCDGERKEWKIPFAQRVNNQNLPEIIKNEMDLQDLEKIELNNLIFS